LLEGEVVGCSLNVEEAKSTEDNEESLVLAENKRAENLDDTLTNE